MKEIIALISMVFTVSVMVGGVISTLSDTIRVNSIEQKAITGDVPNATQELGNFAADKTTEAANDAVAGAILAVIVSFGTAIAGLIYAFIKMLGG
jgi:uncharacterized membrane protein YoaK (UPF0700 family)